MMHLKLFILLLLALVSAHAKNSRLGNFQNREQLDSQGKVFLGWEFDLETNLITFEMEVETTGWVGLGISPSGSMVGADIFIAGVNPDLSTYSNDYYAKEFSQPKIDAHLDWTVIQGVEEGGKTVIKFSRPINSCDDEDYPIGDDTTRLIWAYGDTDEIKYHTPDRRGTKSVKLIGPPTPELELNGLDKFEMVLNMEMPPFETTYWCSYYKAPTLLSKHHVVAFDALLDGLASIKHTHHFIVSTCFVSSDSTETLDDVLGNYTVESGYLGGHCWDPEPAVPRPRVRCDQELFVWAKGGKMMTFPKNVGYPIGNSPAEYYMIQMHFDNPSTLTGVAVRSGVTVYFTNETKEQDAGLLAVLHTTSPIISVPPNAEDYVVVGHCGPSCTSWGIAEVDGVTIFNIGFHSHISGRKFKLRHFRGNQELPWIDYDDHYDFDFQTSHPIKPVKLMPGDQLTTECTYNTKWNEGKVVVGGQSTRNEMCITYIWYYPKQEMDMCESMYPALLHGFDFGITRYHIEEDAVTGPLFYIDDPAYMRGPYHETINNFKNWTDKFVVDYQRQHRFGRHSGGCEKRVKNEYLEQFASYPAQYEVFVPDDACSSRRAEGTRKFDFSGILQTLIICWITLVLAQFS
ncbi:DBH-like monooxygenase protein 1 [Folsomia candida]|uniref:DBH-like monooxygenase protein 1 n=1 Tax=Folsomia candida TaxID=158441 RepID=UPI0016052CBD|nr:DBH-like monooxygenase protein 1 [Folsomia candida]